jgi:isoleucyl-tRNA synthetase
MVMAPFTPFLTEELYRKLTGSESVHLLDWPKAGHVDELILQEMADIRKGVEQGLSQRAAAKLKVRQPLPHAHVYMKHLPADAEAALHYTQIIKEELNVKDATIGEVLAPAGEEGLRETELDLTLTPELKREGMVREVIRNIQTARKQAGLDVDDHIKLALSTTDDELRKAIQEHSEIIASETLADKVELDRTYSFESSAVVGDSPLTISLQKR